MVQLIHKFVPQSRIGIFHNEHTRSTPLDPKCMYWCILSVWVHFGWFHYCMKLGAKRDELEQLMQKFVHEVASKFLAANEPDPPHWTLNS